MSTVAIPIETKVREFDGKLWLGLNLVNRGNRVILGPSDEIPYIFDIIEPDIYITKDPGDSNIRFFDQLRSAGISVCGLDTEGAVFESMDQFAYNKKKILDHVDAFSAWGQKPAKAILQHYNDKNDIHITGNPRFDLLQPHLRSIYQNQAASLNEQYGDYILFNGNFSIANPFSQKQITKIEETYGSVERAKRTYAHRIFYLFIETIYHLQSEFPDTDIIIRPHPSENNTTYANAFRGYDRVHVEDSGDVRTWIAGASVTVHHDCTTGIESALMGVPVVSYRPVQNEKYELKLPQIVSEEALTRKELTDYISFCLNSDQLYEMNAEQTEFLKQYFHNVDESAAENICTVIDSLEIHTEKNYDTLKPDIMSDIERRVKSSELSDQAITIYDRVQRLTGNESHQKQRQYRQQKFPGLEKQEIIERIQQMKHVLEISSVSVEKVPLTNDTFSIQEE